MSFYIPFVILSTAKDLDRSTKLKYYFFSRKSVKFVQYTQATLLIFKPFINLKLYRYLYLKPLFFELGFLATGLLGSQLPLLFLAVDYCKLHSQNQYA